MLIDSQNGEISQPSGRSRPSCCHCVRAADLPIADTALIGQHRPMFDWSDLLLQLPNKVVWALMGLFAVLVAGALIWAKLA